ncbi:hypothetical protein JF66_11085 [Cryobacterium sp. MLB-32]|uniref:hypothetical protein n=1 Tax=Cryobacterium sp. MLB-32 TaxID=1529318 RepID=UPI0004E68AB7|nr:hypothetical protein [Cryobacterium sp. MLB-32]KFF59464.1 hypothetical protein JF66_11085 [Cryobacterium sp. MLB-32]
MTARPHDVTDLYLAPVALGLEHRLEEFADLPADEVAYRVILGSDREPRNASEREAALVETLTRGLELHGWHVSRHPRGLLVGHDNYALVLGLSANLVAYLNG